MSSESITTGWARAFCDELARCGVAEVVVSPGSRSTPLVMAFARDTRFHCRVHLDERSAGFFALGIGKASKKPAAIVTTSGTATANLYPAVIEASRSGVPLLVLTADRPHHLRDSDANQAIDQIRLYGPFVRAFYEVAPATDNEEALRHLRGLAARAVAEASGESAGPVHLNFPLDKPLEPDDTLPASPRDEEAPFVRVHLGRREASPDALETLVAALDSPRGVIVAGPTEDSKRLGSAVASLSMATGFPVLADPLSGARYGLASDAHVVSGYDLFLRDEAVRERLAPSVIVRVGASPTSASLMAWMRQHDGVEHVVVDSGARWKDHAGSATTYVQADGADSLAAAAELVASTADEAWTQLWTRAEASARTAADAGELADHEGVIAGGLAACLPENANLVVSSSMPIRDLDAFGHARTAALNVYANRGASGIDGVVSTAFGVAAATEAATVCLIGDVAFFHDQNGLLFGREPDAPVVFILVDNDGGGIFHMLPIAEHDPDFTKFFATPHGLDFGHASAMHRIEFTDIDVPSLEGAVAAAIESGETRILRVRTDRTRDTARRREVASAVAKSVLEALS